VSVVNIGESGDFEQLGIPLFLDAVTAGFPSPATDYCERKLDLNELCVRNPAATYFVRAAGDSMVDAGIFPGDVLVVDRSITASHGDIVIVSVDGELTVKRLEMRPRMRLVAMNHQYPPIELAEDAELEVFGVATSVVHSLRHS